MALGAKDLRSIAVELGHCIDGRVDRNEIRRKQYPRTAVLIDREIAALRALHARVELEWALQVEAEKRRR